MGKTTTGNTLSITERLRRVFLPCPANSAGNNVTIKVFDKHGLLSEMISSQNMVSEMQNFLKGMGSAPRLPADVAANLTSIHYVVQYHESGPGEDEIKRFAVTDFPIHLLTASGLLRSSGEDIIELLEKHRIPERTHVVGTLSPITLLPVFPYKTIEEDWETNKEVLGMGIPGWYHIPNSQNRCRKIGIIKMQGFMTENLPMARRPEKILSVLKHELGHMFSLRHQAGTIMNAEYGMIADSRYMNDQLAIISLALASLIQH